MQSFPSDIGGFFLIAFVCMSLDAEELAEEVLDGANISIDGEEFADHVANGHRFLQSEVFKSVVKPLICEFARQAEAENYDPRNKQELKECKEIADAMDWHY